jgi:hypothetical protein
MPPRLQQEELKMKLFFINQPGNHVKAFIKNVNPHFKSRGFPPGLAR